ncbi:MAG TPA: hypothetical protein VGM66_05755 [Candidatus Udaeobacter sp.]|jgi:hypothetical protein
MKTSKTEIRLLLKKSSEATRLDNRDEILSGHAPNAVIFDVLPRLKYRTRIDALLDEGKDDAGNAAFRE